MANDNDDFRELRATLPPGVDGLEATGFEGFEAVSELFHFRLDLRGSIETSVAFGSVVGKPISAAIELANGKKRFFHGIAARFRETGRDDRFVRYCADIRPAFWLLTKRRRCRVFQNKSTVDILREVLGELNVRFAVEEQLIPHNYCVQYRESDFDFASRLMEEEGLHYHFDHSETEHALVISSGRRPAAALDADAEMRFDPVHGGVRRSARIREWVVGQEVAVAEFVLRDSQFQMTGANLDVRGLLAPTANVGRVEHRLGTSGQTSLSCFDYPGGYAHRLDGIDDNGDEQSADLALVHPLGQRVAMIAAEREAANCIQIEGAGDSVHFTAGRSFRLLEHGPGDGSYLLLRVEHSLRPPVSHSTDATWAYSNRFHCLPDGIAYRPPAKTPRPVILGVQSATVVGRGSDDIHVDKYGRIKVHFPWEGAAADSGTSSCWLRVAQGWAGQGWGSHFLPRAGQEVIVGFMEGDPDQPIVLASVYNSKQSPPFTLPDEKTKSGIRSRSSSGASQNYSEISIDDTSGSERMQLHSEGNMVIGVESNQQTYIAGNRVTYIGYGSGPADSDSDSEDDAETGSGSGGSTLLSGKQGDYGDTSSKSDHDNLFSKATNNYWHYTGAVEYIVVGNEFETFGAYEMVSLANSTSIALVSSFNITVAAQVSFAAGWNWNYNLAKAMVSETTQSYLATTSIEMAAGTDLVQTAGGGMSILAGGAMILYASAELAIESAVSMTVTASSIVLTGAVSLIGDVTITGALTVTGDFSVTGALSLIGDVDVVGDVAILGALTVDGQTPMYV